MYLLDAEEYIIVEVAIILYEIIKYYLRKEKGFLNQISN